MDHATNNAVYDRVTQNQVNKAKAQVFAELTQYHFGRPK
jgi:hypothetical protein